MEKSTHTNSCGADGKSTLGTLLVMVYFKLIIQDQEVTFRAYCEFNSSIVQLLSVAGT